jgi:hypothetical protein
MQNRVQNKLPYGDGCFQFISFQRDFVCERKNSLISAQNRVSTRKVDAKTTFFQASSTFPTLAAS